MCRGGCSLCPAADQIAVDLPVPGAAVEYYVQATFQSYDGLTMNSYTYVYPSGAPTSGVQRYTITAASSFTNIQVRGAQTNNLLLASDYLWQGAFAPTGSLVNPTFHFELIAGRIVSRSRSPRQLLTLVTVTAGILSALFVNDTICLL